MLNVNHFEMKCLHEENGMFEYCILKDHLCFPQKVGSGCFEPKVVIVVNHCTAVPVVTV